MLNSQEQSFRAFTRMSDVCVHSKRGRANNVVCSKSDASVAGCSSTSVYADIVRRNIVVQKKMNIKACVTIHRKDDKEMHNSLLSNFRTKMIKEMHNSLLSNFRTKT